MWLKSKTISFAIWCTFFFHVQFLMLYNNSPHIYWFLGDCKPSEVKAFTADYLEKVLEPCDWLAVWSTDVFSVLVEVSLVFFRHKEQLRIAGTTVNCWSHECQPLKSPNKKKCSYRYFYCNMVRCFLWCCSATANRLFQIHEVFYSKKMLYLTQLIPTYILY